MTLMAGRADLAATVRSTAGGSVDLRAAIADVLARDSMIRGDLRVEWPDLGFLALLSPELEQVSGALSVDLDVAGTVNEPTVDGRAALSNGRISVPRWGLVVDMIEATADEQRRTRAADRRHGTCRRRRADDRRHDDARCRRGLAHAPHAARRRRAYRATSRCRSLRDARSHHRRRAARCHRYGQRACAARVARSRRITGASRRAVAGCDRARASAGQPLTAVATAH